MKNKELAINSMLIAITTTIGLLIHIPIGGGLFTLVDVIIFTIALLFGPKKAMIAGGVGAFLIDLIAGYPQDMFFTLLIKGFQGYMVGKIAKKNTFSTRLMAIVLGALISLIGYLIADTIIFVMMSGNINTAITMSIAHFIMPNIPQELMSIVITLIIYPLLKNIKIER